MKEKGGVYPLDVNETREVRKGCYAVSQQAGVSERKQGESDVQS